MDHDVIVPLVKSRYAAIGQTFSADGEIEVPISPGACRLQSVATNSPVKFGA